MKTIERAATVKKADPKLFKAVEEGKISVKKAAAEVKARKPRTKELGFSLGPGQIPAQPKPRSIPKPG